MNRITVEGPIKVQLDGLSLPVEVVDETGRWLGHFVPAAAMVAADECPDSPDELERMHAEKGGRTLPEIWKALGAK
jgi:hypothetical protein